MRLRPTSIRVHGTAGTQLLLPLRDLRQAAAALGLIGRQPEYETIPLNTASLLVPLRLQRRQQRLSAALRYRVSLARVVRLTDDGSVLYRAEQDHCRRFTGAASADLRGGPRRNFQVFNALDFLAEVTQHIPDKGEHLVRYYGWYSHRQRGLRAKSQSAAVSDSDSNAEEITIDRSAVNAQKSAADGPRPGSLSTWAMLIQRVYEIDPLKCPHCGAAMKIVSFIECRQRDVIQRILRHCGLWKNPLRTLASARSPPRRTGQVPDEPCDLELVLDPEFMAAEAIPSETHRSRELQLVLDPEFL